MDIITYMRQYSLEPKRIQLVQPRAGKGANLVLIEAMRGGRSGLVWEPTLVLANEDGSYTKEFKEIYHIV
jgi:tRNA1(Val) A37 N6-methylase TrmN6